MEPVLEKLSSILTLALLAGIWVSLHRRIKSARLQLWTVGWVLVFVHFLMQLFEAGEGNLENLLQFVKLGSLQLASVFFIASLTSFLEDKKKTRLLIAVMAVPMLLFIAGFAFNWHLRLLDAICLACIFFGPPAYILNFRRRVTRESLLWMPIALALGLWAVFKAWHSDATVGFVILLTMGFAMPGLLFFTRYRRGSPGVLTAATGFFLWSAVFIISPLVAPKYPNIQLDFLWNVPKIFVGFGMVLTLLEDQSALESSRERKLNRQLQKFASITSRLLTGAEVNSLCNEIAEAISETTNFRRSVILLCTDSRGTHLAGESGLDVETVSHLEKHCVHLKTDELAQDIANLRRVNSNLGPNSYVMKQEAAQKYCPMRSTETFPRNPNWQPGYELLVPLQATHGHYVGWIFMDDPRDVTRITADEMSKIELLAGDLAVTIGNTTLHRQLVRAEKLAAIGQLVAGVAHELNNPLASIVGYSELLGDEITEGPSRQKLDKLTREALRMKRIIENLLRFARQNSLEKKSSNLESLLQDVLALREYHIRKQEVDIVLAIEPDLPMVALDEDQFKQILLNLLNNSIDALEQCRHKRISVEAVRHGNRVVLRFEDSGPGFLDVNKAFDPFYTTKPVGKGTGLGLSICYGIIKEHGGDIHAVNLEPTGARIVMELPVDSTVRRTTNV